MRHAFSLRTTLDRGRSSGLFVGGPMKKRSLFLVLGIALVATAAMADSVPFPLGAGAEFCPSGGSCSAEFSPQSGTLTVGTASASAFGGDVQPKASAVGGSSVATAVASKTDDMAFAIASVPYETSAPGIFRLNFRVAAAQSAPGATGAFVEVGQGPSAELEFGFFGQLLNILGAGVASVPPFAEAFGASDQGLPSFITGEPSPISSSGGEQSNLLPSPTTEATGTFADTIRFSSQGTTNFNIVLFVFAHGGLAIADPTITPDPVNPNIVVTPLAPPNPNPDTLLLSAAELQSLPLFEQQQLAAIGISSSSTTAAPEPPTLLLLATGLMAAIGLREMKKTARPHNYAAGGRGYCL